MQSLLGRAGFSRWPGSGWEPLCHANRKTGIGYRRAPAIREDGPLARLPVSQRSARPRSKTEPLPLPARGTIDGCKHPPRCHVHHLSAFTLHTHFPSFSFTHYCDAVRKMLDVAQPTRWSQWSQWSRVRLLNLFYIFLALSCRVRIYHSCFSFMEI